MLLKDAIAKRDSLKKESNKIDMWYIKQKGLGMPKNQQLWEAIEKVMKDLDEEVEQLDQRIEKAIEHVVI